MFIPDLDFLPIPDSGVKKAPYLGSRYASLCNTHGQTEIHKSGSLDQHHTGSHTLLRRSSSGMPIENRVELK
jgi:hypothetical protein